MPIAKPAWPALQRGHPLARGLIGAWAFFEAAGNQLNDLSATRSTGTLSGSTLPAWVGGDAGSALSFNGVTSGTYVNLPAISGFSTAAFTFLARAKLASFPSNLFPALIKLSPAGNPYGIYVESTSGLVLVLNNAVTRMIPAASVPLNAYFRVGATYDGTTQKLFINGAQADVAHADSGYLDGSVNSIGRGFSAQIFAGQIDEVRVYNRALSSAEMAQDAFDPFAIYRQPSRWWEVPIAAAASFTYFDLTNPTPDFLLRRAEMVGY